MRVILSAALVCALFGCDKKQPEATGTTTESKPIDLDTSKPGPEAPPPPPAASGTPVDTCAFVTKDQVKAVLGTDPEGEPEKNAATGSMLGGCNWRDKDFKSMLSVQARPAGEFEATAKYAKGQKEVPGIGEKAYMTEAGMFVKVAGKPYFLHVMAMGADAKQDEAKATELAKAAAAGAK